MAMQAITLEILEKADLPPRQARAIAHAIELEFSAAHSALAAVIVEMKHDQKLKMAEQKGERVRWVFLALLLGVGYFLFGHLAT